MANTQSSKGNPASKRMGNDKLKARRARSWERGETRKRARQAAQDKAHTRNVQLKSDGIPTPWERSKALARSK
jgi:hypothetical protein